MDEEKGRLADYLDAIVKAMNALGIKVGSDFKSALQKAENDGKERTFKAGNVAKMNVNKRQPSKLLHLVG